MNPCTPPHGRMVIARVVLQDNSELEEGHP